MGFVHSKETAQWHTVQSMSKAETRLLLAAYVASRVSKQEDRQLFLGRGARRKRRVKEANLPAHVQPPQLVSLLAGD